MAKPLGDSVVVESAKVEHKRAQATFGVRRRIPSKTIASAIPRMLELTRKYLAKIGVDSYTAPFFRFHAINMGVEYDLEVGYLCAESVPPDREFVSNVLPEGKYVTLKYAGKNRGYQGNRALIEWARANQHELDCWDGEIGDTFACRYEVYLTDIDTEPDNKKWIKEVAIKIK
jgi:effector-binding domain-containing protein